MATADDVKGLRRESVGGARLRDLAGKDLSVRRARRLSGDNGDYQGHVTAIDLGSGAQKVFNSTCSDQAVHFARIPATPNCATARSAIWARPSVIHHAPLDRIYMGTGNGTYNGNAGGFHWSESIIALNPNGTGTGTKPLDAYTPTNFQALDDSDADLGSTAPAILPVPPSSAVRILRCSPGRTRSCAWSTSPI
jgi:hypothetical protein